MNYREVKKIKEKEAGQSFFAHQYSGVLSGGQNNCLPYKYSIKFSL